MTRRGAHAAVGGAVSAVLRAAETHPLFPGADALTPRGGGAKSALCVVGRFLRAFAAVEKSCRVSGGVHKNNNGIEGNAYFLAALARRLRCRLHISGESPVPSRRSLARHYRVGRSHADGGNMVTFRRCGRAHGGEGFLPSPPSFVFLSLRRWSPGFHRRENVHNKSSAERRSFGEGRRGHGMPGRRLYFTAWSADRRSMARRSGFPPRGL